MTPKQLLEKHNGDPLAAVGNYGTATTVVCEALWPDVHSNRYQLLLNSPRTARRGGGGCYWQVFCDRFDKGVYPPKVERSKLGAWPDIENEPMPRECESRKERGWDVEENI